MLLILELIEDHKDDTRCPAIICARDYTSWARLATSPPDFAEERKNLLS